MKIITLPLSGSVGNVDVIIERKKVKKLRLKVYPDGTVKMSVPLRVANKFIENFLKEKTQWIEKSLSFYEKTRPTEMDVGVYSGASTRILGRQLRISVDQGSSYRVGQKGDHIYIHSPKYQDQAAIQKQFERWWQRQSKVYFSELIDRLYPIIGKYGFAKPRLQVRRMKTLWGSCSRRHCKINLNYYLYKAPPPCVEYVVLHELAHFLYPKHDKDFYEFLTVQMPDWKERKRILDHEIVRGLGY